MIKMFLLFTAKVAAATLIIQLVDGFTGIFTQIRTLAASMIPARKA